jgi:hypothetical protein
MPRLTGLLICAALMLAAGAAFASTGAGSMPSARLATDTGLRVALLEGLPGYGQPEPAPAPAAAEGHKKSYGVAIPLAIVGFGAGHFYAGATWRGLKYLAYDVIGAALDVVIYIYSSYDMNYTLIVMGIVFAGSRVFEVIDVAQTVNMYNKGFDVSESSRELVPPSLRHVAAASPGMKPLFTF